VIANTDGKQISKLRTSYWGPRIIQSSKNGTRPKMKSLARARSMVNASYIALAPSVVRRVGKLGAFPTLRLW
jgi:hypothetical protein